MVSSVFIGGRSASFDLPSPEPQAYSAPADALGAWPTHCRQPSSSRPSPAAYSALTRRETNAEEANFQAHQDLVLALRCDPSRSGGHIAALTPAAPSLPIPRRRGIWSSLVHLFNPTPGRAPACPPLNATDLMVRAHFQQGGAHSQVRAFDLAWGDLARYPKAAQVQWARRCLADLYATTLNAATLTPHSIEAFSLCTQVGHRAVMLEPSCAEAWQQLAVAYSIVQAPLSEGRRCADEALACLRRGQRSTAHGLPPAATMSASFCFAYWRLFRHDAGRKPLAEQALRYYLAAPAHERLFDHELEQLREWTTLLS